MHLNDGQIRAYIDGEPGEGPGGEVLSLAQVEAHLAACLECRDRLQAAQARAARVGQYMAFFASQPEGASAGAPAIGRPPLEKLRNRTAKNKETSMFQKLFNFRSRPLWAGVIVVALLVVFLSIPTGRAWAGEFLGLFRVQQIQVLPVDISGLTSLTGDSSLGKQVSQLVSQSVTVEKQPGDPQVVADAAEAGRLAGFDVRLPDNQTGPLQLTVQGSAAFQFTVDRARAQALLDEAGRSDLTLPESLDGAVISVEIPASVSAGYGNCPTPGQAIGDPDAPQGGSNGRRYAGCVIYSQIPSPTVNTPPNVDVAALAQIGLEFTGMTAEQAKAFTDTVDWTSSLVIPIPKNAATYEQVQVDGVTGTLIQRPVDDAPEYLLIWVKDGIIYTIGGLGSDTSRAIEMANALK